MSVAADKQLFHDLVTTANALFVSDADFVTINGVTKPTLKKIYAEFLASIGTYPTVVEGLTKTNGTGTDNRFFTVPSTGDKAETRYRNDAGVAVEINSILSFIANALTINRGKAYPLRQMNRGGTTSAASTILNNLILDVKVIGDASLIDGHYFRIAYFQNEATASGDSDHGIVIEQFNIDSYASTGTATIIHNHTDTPAAIVRSGGVQTFVVIPAGVPLLRFVITIDAAYLPAAGTPIIAQNPANAAYSWIIDPSCYQRVAGMGNSITVNRGRVYPARAATRNNVTSAADSVGFHLNALLDVKVVGARPGYYYKFAYFKNGASVSGSYRDGWTIHEIAIDGYETADNPVTEVLRHTEYAPDILRSGIQTVKLDCPRYPSLKFYFVLDGEKLPPLGTPLYTQRPFDGGYSWVIDPSKYVYLETSGGTSSGDVSGAYWSVSGSQVSVAWRSGASLYRLVFGPNGFNDLPNIISLSRATGTDPKTAAWTVISNSPTDWLPPLVVSADANGDPGAAAIYTGGNHGSDGSAGGNKTARNILCRIMADGQQVFSASEGWAQNVSVLIINEVMAYNTLVSGRYVLRESINVQIRPGALDMTFDRAALEAVTVEGDNGPQTVTTGFQGTQLFYGGTNTARVAFDPTASSGTKSAAPNAWALVFQDPANGQLATWMDREYGVGNGSNVASNRAYVRMGGATNPKAYHAAIAGTPLQLAAGQSYKWRGGYALQAPGLQTAGVDSFFNHYRAGRQVMAYAMPDAKWIAV
ncbi:hypothetical protein A0O30_23780 [Pseudomonas sp. LLC-1]|uniref:hypothetical protein n=1 Tax=Pseudomonas sp. LLC-1 TaxID=1812180 RepID=UPI000D015CAA|nr:hypothetical protein [Pseudomonas sp. LLC-1]PRN02227.1 hypothetical protein A0O30_23780 [Pseudomonas sp. LLC-1]